LVILEIGSCFFAQAGLDHNPPIFCAGITGGISHLFLCWDIPVGQVPPCPTVFCLDGSHELFPSDGLEL
jgi:hypothetical protein